MTESRPALAAFLQSQLGLLLITSVMIPLITFLYHSWRDQVVTDNQSAIEKRIIVYRLDIVLHSLGQAGHSHLCRAFDALQGRAGCYQPLYPEVEANIPLAGLIYRVMPEAVLAGEGVPQPVETLSQITDTLLPLAGPDAPHAGLDVAYREQSQEIRILRERLLGQYPRLKSELKLNGG